MNTTELIKRMKENRLTVNDINIIGNRLILLDSLKEFGKDGLIYKDDDKKGFYTIEADIFALIEEVGVIVQ